MYSTAFWCLFVVLLFFFWLYCVATVTPFITGGPSSKHRHSSTREQSNKRSGMRKIPTVLQSREKTCRFSNYENERISIKKTAYLT